MRACVEDYSTLTFIKKKRKERERKEKEKKMGKKAWGVVGREICALISDAMGLAVAGPSRIRKS